MTKVDDALALKIMKKYMASWEADSDKKHWEIAENAWTQAKHLAESLMKNAEDWESASGKERFRNVKDTEEAVTHVVEAFAEALALSAMAADAERTNAEEIQLAKDWVEAKEAELAGRIAQETNLEAVESAFQRRIAAWNNWSEERWKKDPCNAEKEYMAQYVFEAADQEWKTAKRTLELREEDIVK